MKKRALIITVIFILFTGGGIWAVIEGEQELGEQKEILPVRVISQTFLHAYIQDYGLGKKIIGTKVGKSVAKNLEYRQVADIGAETSEVGKKISGQITAGLVAKGGTSSIVKDYLTKNGILNGVAVGIIVLISGLAMLVLAGKKPEIN